jgi:hypothetical protein
MAGTRSWPLDSPISLGAGTCFLLVFFLGLCFNLNPRAARLGRPGSTNDDAFDRRMGAVLMCIFGPLAILVLMMSWVRSNNARYTFLDKDD